MTLGQLGMRNMGAIDTLSQRGRHQFTTGFASQAPFLARALPMLPMRMRDGSTEESLRHEIPGETAAPSVPIDLSAPFTKKTVEKAAEK
jgi:hypothetical protein